MLAPSSAPKPAHSWNALKPAQLRIANTTLGVIGKWHRIAQAFADGIVKYKVLDVVAVPYAITIVSRGSDARNHASSEEIASCSDGECGPDVIRSDSSESEIVEFSKCHRLAVVLATVPRWKRSRAH